VECALLARYDNARHGAGAIGFEVGDWDQPL
jgi:hypothetical protein